MQVAVIGLGYVGLPLAVEFAKAGLDVVGVDLSQEKVDIINGGESHILDVPTELVAELVEDGKLRATTDSAVLADAEAICICVPTPLRKSMDPDISYIVKAVDQIAPHLHPGVLVVLESTTYPGTTEEVVLPRLSASGMKVGEDFFLAFSPERVDPANEKYQTRNTPKVIGGVTPECTERAMKLYGHAVDHPVPVSSAKCAEMTKLLENTFRAINIGLVNELALMCDRLNLNVWEVIDAASTKPFGFMPFYPGPGLGGHCIPIDPLYLSWKLRTINYTARFIELASTINSNMPHHVVQKVADMLNDARRSINGSKILLLGVSYKKNVSDVRESPALDILGLLKAKGAEVSYADPFVPELEFLGETMHAHSLEDGIAHFDCVVILTNHDAFDFAQVAREAALVFDARNAMAGVPKPASCTVVSL